MNLARASLYNLITKIILFFLLMFSSVVIVRFVGAEGRGVLIVVNTFFGLMTSLGFMSLGSGLIYYASRSNQKNSYINSALLYSIVISAVLVSISLVFKDYLKNLFFEDIPIKYFYFGVGLILLWCLGKITEAINRVMRNPKIYNSSLLLGPVIYVSCLVIFWIFLGNITVGLTLLSLAISLLLQVIFVLYIYRRIINISEISFKSIKDMWQFSIREHMGVVAQKMNLKLDILIMSSLITLREIGIYSIAVLFAQLVWYIPDSIGTFLYPQIAEKDDQVSSAHLIMKINRINFTLVVIVSIFLFLSSDVLIPWMYGNDFILSSKAIKILLLGTIGLSIAKILTKYFAGVGKPIICSYGTSIGLLFNIPLLLYLIPEYGILGAALATSISYIVISTYLVWVFIADNKGIALLMDLFVIRKQDIYDLSHKLKFKKQPNVQVN